MAKIETIRHSLSHIMAQIVQELFPGVKFGIGPAIENGFYYDFDLSQSLTPGDLPKIEDKMRQIIKQNLSFKKRGVSKKEAQKIFQNQPYKLELIKEMSGEKITVYESGNFLDLCQGPHVKSTKEIPIKGFKITKIAGAYWRGDEKNPMLTRIYGVAFNTEEELKKFLEREAEAEKRDHRVLGKKLELFLIDEEFGSGLPLWLPKGAILRKIIMDFALNAYLERGYKLVATPHIANLQLWKRSGHWDFYRESMYSPIKVEKEFYMIKPMNCPGHVKIYNSKIRSYRDLPLRFTEMGTVYRYERSGTLHGLTRVRGFTQDDAHLFCAPEQLHSELLSMIDLTLYILKSFGFKEFKVSLSVRDPKKKTNYLGSNKIWNLAEKALEEALKAKKLSYKRYLGEAVFYGPKIDFLVKDTIGREWQLTTIQVDFNFPEKFNLNFINKKGQKKRPIMIHRALLGSLERFIGVLIEHYGGAFPLWLSPIQLVVIPVGSRHRKYAKEIGKVLKEENLRTEVWTEAETVSKKIREAEVQKIPYMLVVGDKEIKTKSVRIRKRDKGDVGIIKLTKFIEKVKKEIKEKK
ncbi:threonyl-tRNA synthetase [Parcubacteria bacterium DG_74_3]|nr:MAG: threonyl-tRNA synthetase [Parcubacteria bacterium DG_74_3]